MLWSLLHQYCCTNFLKYRIVFFFTPSPQVAKYIEPVVIWPLFTNIVFTSKPMVIQIESRAGIEFDLLFSSYYHLLKLQVVHTYGFCFSQASAIIGYNVASQKRRLALSTSGIFVNSLSESTSSSFPASCRAWAVAMNT